MSKKEKISSNKKHISLSNNADRIKAISVSVGLAVVFVAAVVLSIVIYAWWAFIVALVSPVALYISVKFTIAVYKRGVDLTGDTVEFEPEYRYFVKFNRKELTKIYIKDPKTNKECEKAPKYKNKEIVFVLKNKDKHGYPLSHFTEENVEELKKSLIG